MSGDLVSATRHGDVCLVRLQREHKLNALSEELAGQLIAVMASDAVTGSRVVVLAGSPRPSRPAPI